ncbi:MAG: nucleoside 2-deoxyribosyltransferase [Bacilli bacterium]|nr:nucleoside 2-deoxyribosyltransferase [Bacilli bacterium]
MYLYLAGALSHYRRINKMQKGIDWRRKIDSWAEDLNIKTFNPAKDFLMEKNHTYNPRLCVDQNEYYLDKCDIMVCNLNEINFSPGTVYEIVRFKDMRKPVIAFGTKHNSPHINSCISHQCETLEEVIELLINMFSQ